MANGRNAGKRQRKDPDRDEGGFIALPWSVLDSPNWRLLSHPARALLLEIARQQYVNEKREDNNGRLLASAAHLSPRGWKSADVLTRAKRELIAAGFIFETVKGHRPNRASWYALTWRALPRHPDFDAGAARAFERGAYRKPPAEDARLTPPHGVAMPPIAPRHGVANAPPTPPHGAIRPGLEPSPTPSDGNHLETPSSAFGPPGLHCIPDPRTST